MAAIGEAFRRVRSGEATVMLTGGSDVPQAYGVARAWEALRVMALGDAETSATACKPFSAERRGLVLGEGGAALVLEAWDHAVARGAAARGVWMEINASPERLDLHASLIRRAMALGCKFVISTDAHHPKHLANMRFGVRMACRGWLEAGDVMNTLPLASMSAAIGKQ